MRYLHIGNNAGFTLIFQRLLVTLEESLYIHNIRDMKVIEFLSKVTSIQMINP